MSDVRIDRAHVHTGGGDIVGGDKHVVVNNYGTINQLPDASVFAAMVAQHMTAAAITGIPVAVAVNHLRTCGFDVTSASPADIESALAEAAARYVALQARIAALEDADATIVRFRRAARESLEAGDLAAADEQVSLTETAQELAALSRLFNEQLTTAARQVASCPDAALPAVQLALASAATVEMRELAFLERLGDTGDGAIARSKEYWRSQQLQLQILQAQAYLLLNKPDRARRVIESTRARFKPFALPAEAVTLMDQIQRACDASGPAR